MRLLIETRTGTVENNETRICLRRFADAPARPFSLRLVSSRR